MTAWYSLSIAIEIINVLPKQTGRREPGFKTARADGRYDKLMIDWINCLYPSETCFITNTVHWRIMHVCYHIQFDFSTFNAKCVKREIMEKWPQKTRWLERFVSPCRTEEALRLLLDRREAELREAMKLRHSLTTLLHMLRNNMEQVRKTTVHSLERCPLKMYGYVPACILKLCTKNILYW